MGRATAKKLDEVQQIVVPKIEIAKMSIWLVGDTSLIVHRWSEKAKRQMLDKQMGRAAQKKPKKDPQKDFEESLYKIPGGGYGFPSVGFKAAAVSACRFVEAIKMTEARGAFHVEGELLRVLGTPTPREDMVRVGMGVADIRYRAEFKEWLVEVPVRFNTRALTAEQIINLFNTAGFGVGVGEWRPEKNGQHGMFHVGDDTEVRRLLKKRGA